MSIRARPGGRWQVRIRTGNGRRIEQTLPPGATRRDAQRLEAQLIARQVALSTGQKPRRLIDEALTEWVETQAKALKSWDRDLKYRVEVTRLYTAGRHLDELQDVAQAIIKDGRKEGLAPATINRQLAILRRIGNLAFKWGWTDTPYGQRISMLPGERTREVFLTADQVRALLEHCSPEVADVVRLATLTGLRRGEIMRLTPANIVAGSIILDSNTKSGKPRVVPLPPQAALIVANRLPWQVTVWEVRNGFERARVAAGMPHVHLHDLRHTYASWLVQGGASLTAVRDLLGHSSLAVTSKYAHLARPDLAKATRRLKV